MTYLLHPFAATSSNGDYAVAATVVTGVRVYHIAIIRMFNGRDRSVEIEVCLILQIFIQIFKDDVINICSKVSYGSVQKLQLVLHTYLLEFRSCSRVELCSFTAVFHVDVINIFHKVYGLVFSYIFVEGTSEVISDVVFSI